MIGSRIRTFVWATMCLLLAAGAVATAQSNNGVTVTVGPTLQCLQLNRTLYTGISGTDVRAVQQFLISNGLLSADSATGYYGVLTTQAVRTYQASRGIDTTGTVGPLTRARMTAESCGMVGQPAGTPISVSTAPVPTQAPTIDSVEPRIVSVGSVVKITGSNFDPRNNTVLFGNVALSAIPSPDGKSISFPVPDTTLSCPTYSPTGCDPQAGTTINPGTNDEGRVFQMYVSNQQGISKAVSMTVRSGIVKPSDDHAPSLASSFTPHALRTGELGYWMLTLRHQAGKVFQVYVDWGDGSGGPNKRSQVGRIISRGEDRITITHEYNSTGGFTPRIILVDEQTDSTREWSVNHVTVSATINPPTHNPSFETIYPRDVKVGDQLLLIGSGFSRHDNTVFFGPGVISGLDSVNAGTVIFLTVPAYINPCQTVNIGNCSLGAIPVTPNEYRIAVRNANNRQTDMFTISVKR